MVAKEQQIVLISFHYILSDIFYLSQEEAFKEGKSRTVNTDREITDQCTSSTAQKSEMVLIK